MRGNTFSKKWAYRVKFFMYFDAALARNAYFRVFIVEGTLQLDERLIDTLLYCLLLNRRHGRGGNAS